MNQDRRTRTHRNREALADAARRLLPPEEARAVNDLLGGVDGDGGAERRQLLLGRLTAAGLPLKEADLQALAADDALIEALLDQLRTGQLPTTAEVRALLQRHAQNSGS